MVGGLDYKSWRSLSGAPWPARDEFEMGCTMEHAGYQITPLVMLFGPVRKVSAFNACLMPEKNADVGAEIVSPDFSVGMLEFDNGVVARITNSILAPANRSLRVVGVDGVATVTDVWEYNAPVRMSATGTRFMPRLFRWIEKRLFQFVPGLLIGRAAKAVPGRVAGKTVGGRRMDFVRGIAQMAAQLQGNAEQRIWAELALHVTEVTLALQAPDSNGRSVTMTTGF
jgi:predicted dehydrogenase